MSARQDPPRLVDSDDPVLRAALGAGRSELPGDERMRALSAAFVARLGTGGGGGGGTPGDAAPNASGGSGASAGTAGTGGAGAATGGAGGMTMALGGAAVAIVVALGVWQSGRSDAPIAAVSATPVEASAPAALPAPSAAPVPAEPSAAVDTLPFEALPSASASVSAAAPSPSASPEMEMEVFKRAQAALSSGDAAGALAACAAHQQAYPRSAFAQEREVIAIDALVRLGRRGEAEARAHRFARSWPSSGHNRRIDSLLGR